MATVADLMARIRASGANVELDGGKLKLVNGKKLPGGALDFIKRSAKAIADFLEAEGDMGELSAIMEHDGGMPRPVADDLARLLLANPPKDVNAADWTWFIGKATEVLDRRAA